MDKAIKAIIFDLGRVIIDFDHRIAADKIAGLADKSSQDIFDLFFDSSLIQSFEEGNIAPVDFFNQVKKALGLGIGFAEFLPIWNEIFFLTRENKAVCDLAKKLRKSYVLALLSNVNKLHFEYIRKNFSVLSPFHHLLTSYELGFSKPDPLIYRKTLKVLKVLPQEAFYVDDRSELIEAAAKLGIRSFVFKGVEQLKTDLIGCGVKIG
jgi:FMN phosphatase YigB (HAD superfamily)